MRPSGFAYGKNVLNRQQTLSKQEKWSVAILFVAALAVRFVYLAEIRGNPLFENPRLDALFHDLWAQSIASGNIWGDTVFFRAPLYPYILAALYKIFGHSYLIVRIVQHVLGATVVVFVYLAARMMFGKAPAFIASLFISFYAVLVYFEGELLFESFLTFLCALWLFVFMRAMQHRTSGAWAVSGIVYGLICATRPTFLVVIVPVLAYVGFRGATDLRRSTLLVAVFLLGMSLPIVPITLRNYIVGGEVVLIASQGGVNFFIGNNEKADGVSSSIPGVDGTSWETSAQTSYVEVSIGHKPNASEESWFWYSKGLAFIVHHPADAAALLIKKAYLFWNKFEIPNNQSFYTFTQQSMLLRVLPVRFWLVGTLGIVGMILSWQNPNARVVTIFVFIHFLVTIAFFVCDRFRVPILPPLSIFAAYALWVLWENVRDHKWRQLGRNTVLLAGSAVLVNSSLYAVDLRNPAQDFLRLALVAINKADYPAAVKYCEQSSELNENMPNVHLVRGVAEWMLNNTGAAKREFTRELERNPQSYGTLVNLSRLYSEERKPDSAIIFGSKAIQLRSRVPIGYTVTAKGFELRNDVQSAESLLHVGSTMCGDDFLYGEFMLARIEHVRGEIQQAERRYRLILSALHHVAQPQYELEFGFSEENKSGESNDVLRSKAANGLGEVFGARKQLDSAATLFTVATQSDSTNADAWSNLGIALMQQRNYTGAESALKRAVLINNHNPAYWYNLGVLYGNDRRLRDAKRAFEKVVELQPDFPSAQNMLALTERLMQ